ncbi:putative nuclease HARBI1 [Folsomia candida]|uniref:Putative nuclease HARBI1 n=1 Tax=Folsomia candida TaxID=158441 RepID=A0A226DTP8_FOLCA|nr:putative nuclease HARBI1 [Folsomia candida]
MPLKTSKQELMEFLELLGCSEIFFFDNVQSALEVLETMAFFEASRYIEDRKAVPKSVHWLENVLPQLNEKRFRAQLRVNKATFLDLLEIIKGTIAQSNHQEPLELQLAVALNQLGTYGNASSSENIATKFGLSHGFVNNYTNRIIEGLLAISDDWIRWPNEDERRRISNEMFQNGLPKCVGFVDGSHAPFFKAPMEDKETYWSRKKEYSLQFQIICDPNRIIRHFYTGYPGSVHDAKVFAACDIAKNPNHFFSPGEYIIGDSAYPKSETVVVPYKRRQGQLTQTQRAFKKYISSHRIAVEHTIGLLKGRFQSLKQIRIQIDRNGHVKCCRWIKACVVLHNILMHRDPWTENDEMVVEADDEQDDENLELGNAITAEAKRTALCEIILAMK